MSNSLYLNDNLTLLNSTNSYNVSSGSLIVIGGVGINGNLYNNNAIFQTVNIQNATIQNLLTVTPNLSATTLNISGSSSLGSLNAGATTVAGLTAAATNLSSLTVSGTSSFAVLNANSLNISGLSTLTSLTVPGTSTLAVTNATTFVAGSSTIGTLNAAATVVTTLNAGATTVAALTAAATNLSSLTVSGTSSFGVLNATSLNISGLSTLTSLTVPGTSTLAATNISTLNAGATVVTTLNAAATVVTTLNAGATTVAALTAAATNLSSLTVSGTSSFAVLNATSLNISGLSTLTSLTVPGTSTLAVTNATTFVAGSSTIGTLNAGATTVAALIATATNLSSLTVSGTSSFGGSLAIGNYMDMTSVTAPMSPTSGVSRIYEETGVLKAKSSNGVVTTFQPSTTKGDIISHNGTTQTRVPVGIQNQFLVVDSTTTTGVAWKNFSSVGNAVQQSQYAKTINLQGQGITSTLTPIQFGTNLWVDSGTYEIPISNNFLRIKNSGNYMVFVKLAANNTLFVNNTTIYWSMYSDYTTTNGTNFSPEVGVEGYTTHSSGSGYDTTTLGFSWIVPPGGVLAQLRGQIVSGGSTVTITLSACSFAIYYIPNNHIIDTWKPEWTTMSTTIGTYTDIVINNVYLQDSIYTYTPPLATFMTTVTGQYTVSAKLTFQKTSGVDLTSASVRLIDQTGTVFAGGLSGTSYLTTGSGTTNLVTVVIICIVNLTANVTTIRMQGAIDVGSNVQASGGFLLSYIDPIVYVSKNEFIASSTVTTTLTSSWIDVPVNTVTTNVGSLGYTSGNSTITMVNSGMCRLMATINVNNSSNITGRGLFGQFLSSFDNGTTWNVIQGSLNNKNIGRKSGIPLHSLFQCSPGTMIKAQIRTDGVSGDGILMNPCNISICTPENITSPDTFVTVYGSQYQYVQSLDNIIVPLTTYTEVFRMSTAYLSGGMYRCTVNGIVTLSAASTIANLVLYSIGPDLILNKVFFQYCGVAKTGDVTIEQTSIIKLNPGVTQLIVFANTNLPGNAYTFGFVMDLVRVL